MLIFYRVSVILYIRLYYNLDRCVKTQGTESHV